MSILNYAVFGKPIIHSLSPLIHQFFAKSFDINLSYKAIEVKHNLADSLADFRKMDGLGANITVPFKEDAYKLADIVHPRAKLAGASNTLWWDEKQKLHADNTDGEGLLSAITIHGKTLLENKSILILGAGGASRGVLMPLLSQSPKLITIANRTFDKAKTLITQFEPHAGNSKLQAVALEELFLNTANVTQTAFDVVINATSLGLISSNIKSRLLSDLPKCLSHANTLVVDMIYSKDTPMLQWAKKHQLKHQDGIYMLVEQAAGAFFLWHGKRPNVMPVLDELNKTLMTS